MNIILMAFIAAILAVDFYRLKKTNPKIIYLYWGIVFCICIVFLLDQWDLFPISPVEIWIQKMTPLTDWLEAHLTSS